MDKLPFEPYDFFGYLASGLALLAGMQFVFGFPPLLDSQQTVIEGLLLLLAAYVLGHVIAMPAKAFFEDLVVGRILGRPATNLFLAKRPSVLGIIFPGYYTPLPQSIRAQVLARAHRDGSSREGEDLFLHVRYSPDIRNDERLMRRLSSFLNQYGFNRNLSFSLLVIGVGLLVKSSAANGTPLAGYAICALILGLCLFYRYLKFYRQYSYEMFNSYRAEALTAHPTS